ncbi:MAG: thiamine pyrophosphate-dependent enzyme [Dehalococcoidia bacterium]
MLTVGEALVERLVELGVRRAYTVPGESFLPVIDAFDQHPDVRLVSTRHESGAAFMAEGEAKLTGRPAVAMGTRGPGASNMAIGVHTAREDSTPMIVLLGDVETTRTTRQAFQEVNLPDFYRQFTKFSATIQHPQRSVELLDRAWHAATSGRPGPAMLSLPADILDNEFEGRDGWSPSVAHTTASRLDDADARMIVDRLRSADCPVIVAGGGARTASQELVRLAEAVGAGVYAGFRRQDTFPNDHPQYCGHLTLGTPPELLEAIQRADVVLVAGSRLGEPTSQTYTVPRPESWIAQLDADPSSVGAVVSVDLGAVVNVPAALAQLSDVAESDERVQRDWSSAHDAFLRTSVPRAAIGEGAGIDPEEVVAAMVRTIPDDAIITNDAGNFATFVNRFWRFNHPFTQVAPTNGAMGYGLPAAIGAALACPDREVVATCGDGGFMMTAAEIETAVRLGTDLTAIVFRNGLYGTIAMHQARDIGRLSAVGIGDVDIAGMTRAMGASGWTVTHRDQLEGALMEARTTAGPSIIDVLIDGDAILPSTRLSSLYSPVDG